MGCGGSRVGPKPGSDSDSDSGSDGAKGGTGADKKGAAGGDAAEGEATAADASPSPAKASHKGEGEGGGEGEGAGEDMPDHPAVGTYVCCPDEDTMSDIDHHHVKVKAEGSQLRWCNRAGVSWRLTPRADGDLDVDKECPYYEGGYTVCKFFTQVYNGSTLVTSLLGPSGETYGLSGSSDPVCYGDLIKLVNRYDPTKGYLDTCNHNATNTGFGVQTSSNPNRDGCSGTWHLEVVGGERLDCVAPWVREQADEEDEE